MPLLLIQAHLIIVPFEVVSGEIIHSAVQVLPSLLALINRDTVNIALFAVNDTIQYMYLSRFTPGLLL